ncbi:putative glutamyl-tRNA(Gln) amidotransferase subunit A [Colletotrichum sublineola]|uniref:Putative glutamyl-tRNA(Gln) amidotransferase subunit A n=1 Tax=Colletotrichum sublineola TaxID=1173701 RepID=A0A066X1F9_COLSU|nr:putative glutamyl-tRNA(Gln) amidotransferase subunit A [Colletotrichum sublineola]
MDYSTKGSTISYPVTVNGIHLLAASARDIAEALNQQHVTSEQLVDAYIARIEANDRTGLNLQSVIEIAPTAREVAKKLDEERQSGAIRSAIHGLPILVKDNYNVDTELGVNTTAGSYALLGSHASGDAFVVKKLRDAGAIILGKANLNEFSGQRGAVNSSAWSARGGRISSAYVFGGFSAGGDPSGSSGGSAVSVSAGFAAAALGTDTEGSIGSPANRAALFGLRPSTGLTSRTGVVPISSSQDTTGPLAKSVWDVAALLEIMAVHDDEDAYSAAAEPFRLKNYTQFVDGPSFKGLRVGVPREPFWNQTFQQYRAATNPALDAVLDKMRDLGAEIIDPVVLPNEADWRYPFVGGAKRDSAGAIIIRKSTAMPRTQYTRLQSTNPRLMLPEHDTKEDMANYLTRYRTNTTGMESLFDIISFNEANVELESAPGVYGQDSFLAADQTGPRNTSSEYWHAKYVQEQLGKDGIEAVFRLHKLDVLAVPTEGSASRFGAVGRCPVGNVPVGYDEINLPFGMSFVGKRYDEATVLRAMAAFEANFPARELPPTLD